MFKKINIKENIINFVFLGILIFTFFSMIISNNKIGSPFNYIELSFFDIFSLLISIILIIYIIFCKNKIVKWHLLVILLLYSSISFGFVNKSHIYFLRLDGAESRLIISTLINLILAVVYLRKCKLKILFAVLLFVNITYSLETLESFRLLFIYNDNVLSVLLAYYYELILILFCLKNIKSPFFKGFKKELKILNKKQKKIDQNVYSKKRQLLIDIDFI